MKLLAPDLFERRFAGLMAIGRARLPYLAPEWTDHNAHDPGITLMELLAWAAEAQLYSLARRPRRDERAAYAALFGFEPGGTRAARGVLWPDRRDPQAPATTILHSVVIPADAAIHVVHDDTLAFRPVRRILWVPGRIERLESRSASGRVIDHTTTNERGGPAFLPFGESAGRRDVLALTFASRSDSGLFGKNPDEAKGALWAIGVRAAGPSAEGETKSCQALTATLVAGGARIPLRIVSDSTNGLLSTGALLLDLDDVPGSPTEVTLELRAPNGFARPPRFLRIEPNVVPIEQEQFIARELHDDAKGDPGFAFNLEVAGLRFAAGEEPVTIEVLEPSGAVSKWNRCDRLSDAEPGQSVFELDAVRGRVTFGNEINGRIPPAGSQILASYAVSDGLEGNVARNRAWQVAGFAGTFGVNHDPIAGGSAAPSSAGQRRDARRLLGSAHALISSADLAGAARELPLLEVARAWVLPPTDDAPHTGEVTLVVMRARPDGKEPERVPETPRWRDAIRRRLVSRIPLGTRLAVAAPRYTDFSIEALLIAEAGLDPAAVKEKASQRLNERLAVLERKPGAPVTKRDLRAWLGAVEGVKRIDALRVLDADGRPVDEVAIRRGGLPRYLPDRSTIDVTRAAR